MPIPTLEDVPLRRLLVSTWAVLSGAATTYTGTMAFLGPVLFDGEPGPLSLAATSLSVVAGATLLVVGASLLFAPRPWARYTCCGAFLVLAASLVPAAAGGAIVPTAVAALNLSATVVLLVCPGPGLCRRTTGPGRRVSAARVGIGADRNTPGRGR